MLAWIEVTCGWVEYVGHRGRSLWRSFCPTNGCWHVMMVYWH